MAVKKTNKTPPQSNRALIIFWLVFIAVIAVVFVVNFETIKRNFDLFRTRLTTQPGTGEEFLDNDVIEPETEPVPPPVTVTIGPGETLSPVAESSQPVSQTQTQTPAQTQTPVQTQPPAQTQTDTPPAVQTRDRVIYFMQLDRDGQINQSRVTRRMPVTDSPMTDALNALLLGPATDELGRNIMSFIPGNTRLLSAIVRGTTAYLNFSEDFMFNTFGVEGYIAQLRQIVWTVTEFSTVNDVQFLIEGRVLDYLGEGIWIGSPISRQSF